MSFRDKLTFWKKEEKDDFSNMGQPKDNFDDPFANDINKDPFTPNKDPFAEQDAESSFKPISPNAKMDNLPGKHAGYIEPTQQKENPHQFDLILSKLDTIKMNIENINLRMSKIENELQKNKKNNSW